VILTIFVNPTQFGPNEDLARYPRDEAGDLAKGLDAGIDLAFCPDASAMYRAASQTFVEVRELQKPLCGASRRALRRGRDGRGQAVSHHAAAHRGVRREGLQQLAIIRRMVRDLDFAIEIASVPIVREADGVALSSRNAYLSSEQRRVARSLSAGLAAPSALRRRRAPGGHAGRRRARTIEAEREARIDYVELRDAEELTPVSGLARPAVLAMAVFIGTTRLIDNRVLA